MPYICLAVHNIARHGFRAANFGVWKFFEISPVLKVFAYFIQQIVMPKNIYNPKIHFLKKVFFQHVSKKIKFLQTIKHFWKNKLRLENDAFVYICNVFVKYLYSIYKVKTETENWNRILLFALISENNHFYGNMSSKFSIDLNTWKGQKLLDNSHKSKAYQSDIRRK